MRNTSLIRPRHRDVLQTGVDDLFTGLWPKGSLTDEGVDANMWRPRADVWETDDEYVVRIDVPGIDRDSVVVTLEEGNLRISGERLMDNTESQRNFYRIERLYGRFTRSFAFGRPVQEEGIEARLENGVLTVHVPKAEESKPRRIDIR